MRERWINDYSLGIEEIDKQHRQLLKLYQCLYQSIKKDKPRISQISLILSEFITVTDDHFTTEEKYFQYYDDPEMAEWHKSEHDISMSLLRTFETELEDGLQTAHSALSLISSWFLGHVCGVDQTLKEFTPQISTIETESS